MQKNCSIQESRALLVQPIHNRILGLRINASQVYRERLVCFLQALNLGLEFEGNRLRVDLNTIDDLLNYTVSIFYKLNIHIRFKSEGIP